MNTENTAKPEHTEHTESVKHTDQDVHTEPAGRTSHPTRTERTEPDGMSVPPPTSRNTRPRSWSIVWGVIVLIVCVYSATQLLSPDSVDPTVWVIATTLGLGALLLIVGVVVLLRGRR